MEQFWEPLAWSAGYFLYGLWLLPVLTDWVSFAVDEGYTAYGTDRLLAGEMPHRDFFFLWTPGILYLHGLAQSWGADWLVQRGLALSAASGTVFLAMAWAKKLGVDTPWRLLFGGNLLVWGFTLWNIPYSSWYAVFLAMSASYVLPAKPRLAGTLYGASFWFKQNVGILSFMGALTALLLIRERTPARRLGIWGLAAIGLPFALFAISGGDAFRASVEQIFLFPLQYRKVMAEPLRAEVMAAPLSCFGLWLISLFLVKKGEGKRRTILLIQVTFLAFVLYRGLTAEKFDHGMMFLLSIIAWPLAALAFRFSERSRRENLLLYSLPSFGAFLQVYPRWDFQHFLFVFPLSAVILSYGAQWLAARYETKSKFWIGLPLLGLLVLGVLIQIPGNFIRMRGGTGPYGRIAPEAARSLSMEMRSVGDYLRERGLAEGSPVLILPNATYFYSLEKFHNPTPHNQFFPNYVEAFGSEQKGVLAEFESAGGKYLVIQKRSGTEMNVPEIFSEIQLRYRLARDFPIHFSVWELNP